VFTFKGKTMKRTLISMAVAALAAVSSGANAADPSAVKIGFITDISGLYSDIDGQGGLEAIKMAIADFGGSVLGKPILLHLKLENGLTKTALPLSLVELTPELR
jgi:hypothetical protein